ncbi:hypothetical protein pb186bvf_016486 [Paramecium bursaria]
MSKQISRSSCISQLEQMTLPSTTDLDSRIVVQIQRKLNLENTKYNQYSECGKLLNQQQKINQDYLASLIQEMFQIHIVCDGHGQFGHMVSKFVSEQVLQYLDRAFNNNAQLLLYHTLLYKTLMRHSFAQAAKSLEMSTIPTYRSGTTCNMVVLVNQSILNENDDDQQETVLYCLNVGDSRSILISNSEFDDFNITQLSIDHRPDDQDEKRRIISKGGVIEAIPQIGPLRVWVEDKSGPGLAMTRSFGDRLGQQAGIISDPTIYEQRLTGNDLFIVQASDGIWDCMTNQEVAQYVMNNPNSKELIQFARLRWEARDTHIDDISCTIIKLNS